jgi:hypothetical protein
MNEVTPPMNGHRPCTVANQVNSYEGQSLHEAKLLPALNTRSKIRRQANGPEQRSVASTASSACGRWMSAGLIDFGHDDRRTEDGAEAYIHAVVLDGSPIQ